MLKAENGGMGAMVVSGLFHLVAIGYLRELPSRAPPAPIYTMDFEIAVRAPASTPPVPRDELPSSVFERGTENARRRDAKAQAPRGLGGSSDLAPADSAPAPAAESEPFRLPRPAPARTVDLSPLAAARTLSAGPGTRSVVEAEVGADAGEGREESRLSQSIPELSRAGRTDEAPALHAAEDVNSVIAKPWDLILQPLRGARYVYRGTGFDAIIRADGSVAYRDHTGLQILASQTQNLEGASAGGQPPPARTWGLGFRDALSKKLAGYDPHRSERRRFLERTTQLRELLHQRAFRAALARADAHLDRQLTAVRLKLEAGSGESGRAALFTLWDECSEDAVGEVARRRIEAFVREHCVQGSQAAFSPAELAALNQRRLSTRAFAPYAAGLGDAGTAAPRVDGALR